jgi:hypothetical protein
MQFLSQSTIYLECSLRFNDIHLLFYHSFILFFIAIAQTFIYRTNQLPNLIENNCSLKQLTVLLISIIHQQLL